MQSQYIQSKYSYIKNIAGFLEDVVQFSVLKVTDLLSALKVNPDANAAHTATNKFKLLLNILTPIASK
jgi:hypothetical protein